MTSVNLDELDAADRDLIETYVEHGKTVEYISTRLRQKEELIRAYIDSLKNTTTDIPAELPLTVKATLESAVKKYNFDEIDEKEQEIIKYFFVRKMPLSLIAKKLKRRESLIQAFLNSSRTQDLQWNVTNKQMKKGWKPGKKVSDLTKAFTEFGGCSVTRATARIRAGENTPSKFYIKSSAQKCYFEMEITRKVGYHENDEVIFGRSNGEWTKSKISRVDKENQKYHIQYGGLQKIIPFANAGFLLRKGKVNPYNKLNFQLQEKLIQVNLQPGDLGFTYNGSTVDEVTEDSEACRKGICSGWEIVKINSKPVSNKTKEMNQSIIDAVSKGKEIEFTFRTGSKTKEKKMDLSLYLTAEDPKFISDFSAPKRYCVISHRLENGFELEELEEGTEPDKFMSKKSIFYSSIMFVSSDYGANWVEYKTKGTGKLKSIRDVKNQYLPKPPMSPSAGGSPLSSKSNIIVPDHYSSLQEALRFAKEEEYIFLRSGSYSGDIVIENSVHVIIQGEDGTKLKGQITLSGQSSGTFRDIVVASTEEDCIAMSGNAEWIFEECSFMSEGGQAVSCKDASKITLTECNLGATSAKEQAKCALSMEGQSVATCIGCNINNCSDRGICIVDSSQVQVEDSNIQECNVATYLKDQSSLTLRRCEIKKNEVAIWAVNIETSLQIIGCTVMSNKLTWKSSLRPAKLTETNTKYKEMK